MVLLPYTEDDLALTESLECDAAAMKDLGGPWPKEKIPEIHRRRLAYIAGGTWWFKIVPEAAGPAVGTIGIWPMEWEGAPAHEMGWMVLPAYQGRGFAGGAGRLILERARAESRFEKIHAFPALDNGASNAICRKLGFAPLEPCDIDYAGRPLKCRHWRLDLREIHASK
jgi:RimJ/RimL family protein N-acetyltransferase